MNTVHSVRVAATSLFNADPCLSQFPPQPIAAAPESRGTIATARAAVVIGRGQSSAATKETEVKLRGNVKKTQNETKTTTRKTKTANGVRAGAKSVTEPRPDSRCVD